MCVAYHWGALGGPTWEGDGAVRVAFESSHVDGDFSSGVLRVRVQRDDPARGVSRVDEITFAVPTDFHTHNDAVAAALMTLVGRTFSVVSFSFPISQRCADILRAYYDLADVGPVDPDMEPRRRGRYLGLLLSGGIDSMALWLTLRRVLGDAFKVITTEFGGWFSFEARGYERFHRHVSCRTDFRAKGFADQGRFTLAVPLLFADYADLAAVTTGHHFVHTPLSIESLRDGRQPRFLDHDRPLHAGGLDEVHIARCLNMPGLLMLAMLAEPELLEACWYGSAPPGLDKHYHKGLVFRRLFQRQGRPIPPWLADITPPRRQTRFREGVTVRFTALYLAKHVGIDAVRRGIRDIDDYDLGFLADLDLTFMERYCPNLLGFIPPEIRAGVLAVFHEAGIVPWSERDWQEFDVVRDFCLAHYDGPR